MAIEHDVIPDADLHEPKGIASADANATYLADGLGSGTWGTVGAGCSSITDDGTANTVTTTFAAINAANFGAGTFAWSSNQAENGVTFDTTGGYFEITNAGLYLMHYNLSFAGDDASTSEFQLTLGVDAGAGIVTKEASTTSYRSTTTTGLIGFVAGNCMPSVASGEKLYIMLRRNSGTADVQFFSGNFVVHKVI